MGQTQKNSAENPQPTGPEKKDGKPLLEQGTDKGQPAQSVKDAQDLDFEKKSLKLLETSEKIVKKASERIHSEGVQGSEVKRMMEVRQINRLRTVHSEKQSEFQSIAAAQKAERLSSMLGQTEQALLDITSPYEKLIDHVKHLNVVNDADLVKLEALMSALNKLKTNPVLEKLFFKVFNKEKLNPKEMQTLVDQINPVTLDAKLDKVDTNAVFESSQAGSIIGMMAEDQRPQLVEMMFKSKSGEQAMPFLDSLITANLITNLQLNELIAKHKIPEPYSSQLKEQMEHGEINKKQQDYDRLLRQMEQVNKGQGAENPALKVAGTPAVLAGVGLLGMATALINLKMSWSWSDIPGSIAKTMTNPYFLLGTTAVAGTALYTASYVAPETYGKYKDKFLDFWAGPDKLKAKDLGRREELQSMLEMEFKKNPYLMEFMVTADDFPGKGKKNGSEIIQEIINEKLANKQPIDFDYKEIFAKSGPKQKEFLAKSYAMYGSKDINFKESMRAVMATMTALDQNSPSKVIALVKDIKKKQGIA